MQQPQIPRRAVLATGAAGLTGLTVLQVSGPAQAFPGHAGQDNSGITGPGRTGTGTPDATGGLDLSITEQFARSMSLDEAMARENLLCWGMNGVPLPREHGHPVRLIAPGGTASPTSSG